MSKLGEFGIGAWVFWCAATALSWFLIGTVLAVAFVFGLKDTNLIGAFSSFMGMAIAFGIAVTVIKDSDL